MSAAVPKPAISWVAIAVVVIAIVDAAAQLAPTAWLYFLWLACMLSMTSTPRLRISFLARFKNSMCNRSFRKDIS